MIHVDCISKGVGVDIIIVNTLLKNKLERLFVAKGDDIENKFIEFAVCIIQLTSYIPKTNAGRHVAHQ